MTSPPLSRFIIGSLSVVLLTAYSHASSSTWSAYRDGRNIVRRGPQPRASSVDHETGFLSVDDEKHLNGTNSNTSSSVLFSLSGSEPLLYSTCSVQGERQYMEDEHFVEQGRFAAVFDGHGGAAVSRYLRQNLFANFQSALPTVIDVAEDDRSLKEVSLQPSSQSSIIASALETALNKVDNEVGSISHWSFQGSTALAVVIHDDANDGSRSITTANVGDSRAVLSRGRKAVALTRDHKPNDAAERERIEALGGSVDWCGDVDTRGRPVKHTGVYRINGNLALSRSIGDRSERPWVTNSADLAHHLIDEENDSFVLVATDGLFDVMSSQEAVNFIHDTMDGARSIDRHALKRDVAKYLVEEALQRGSSDNITVLILWINEKSQ
ncbi:hypothetical protein ACHAWF_015993 [Thalassiosira exigua]